MRKGESLDWQRRRWVGAVAVAVLSGMTTFSQAALITVSGGSFDLTYDTTKLGLFGAPTLVGNSVFFSFSGFIAESLNGEGVVTQNSTVSGLVLTAKNGFQFGGFSLAEFGDYKLSGSESAVQVNGQLRAFNLDSPINTQTTAFLAPAAGTPLDFRDGALHEWSAAAHIDGSTAPTAVPSIFGIASNVIQSLPNRVGITVENQLTAYTDAESSGPRLAFIEKKFAGVQMTVAPVPLPPSLALLGAGLGAILLVVQRRQRD